MELLLWAGIALVQAVALPGWLLVRALGLHREGPLQTALLAFGLSLVLNHALVVLLVLMGAYARPVLVGVMAAEVALAALLAARRRAGGPGAEALIAGAREAAGSPWLLLAVAATLGFLVAEVPRSFARVFEYWDAIVSWNRWAVDWEAGRLPANVYDYPQLLPTSWSLLYLIQGHPIQNLARGLMSLFPLATALVFVDLGIRRRSRELMLAAVTSTLLLAAALGHHFGAGLADVPVAAFALLALHPLLGGGFGEAPDRRGAARLLACALLGIGCALTKQAGLYAALLLPGFALASLRAWPVRARFAAVAALAAVLAAGIAPWYAYAESLMARGLEGDELPMLTQRIFGDTPLLERAGWALAQWRSLLTAPGLFATVLLVLASLLRPGTRWITLTIGLPYTVVWALGFSYDVRNHALALPFLGWSAAGGALEVAGAARRLAAGRARAARRAGAGLAAAAAAWLALSSDPRAILEGHEARLLQQGSEVLNRRLLEHARTQGFDGRILTNYRYLTSFEALREHYFVDRDAPAHLLWPFRSGLDRFAAVVEDPSHDIRFILVAGLVDPEIETYLQARVRARTLEPIFQVSGGRLLRVVSKR